VEEERGGGGDRPRELSTRSDSCGILLTPRQDIQSVAEEGGLSRGVQGKRRGGGRGVTRSVF